MVKTQADYQREYRERKKEAEKAADRKVATYFRKPFDEWMGEDRWHDRVTSDFDLVGADTHMPFPGIGNVDPFWREEWNEGPDRGALSCAERMVTVLLDASRGMAHLIRDYKKEQISARIAELEASDLTDPAARKDALAEIVKLTRYVEQLEKETREVYPQWRVRGE